MEKSGENVNKGTCWPGWETVRLIGRGSFGSVYEIQRDVFGDVEKAALKVISIPQNASDIDEMYSDGYDEESITTTFQSHLKSIVGEYSLMRKMNGCSNIVSCDDIRYVPHEDGIGWDIFIKMELLTPLAKALPNEVPEATVVEIAKDLCVALELCRKYGIVHRDIKPQNIFVSPNGDYKLGDFGIAKTVEKTMGGTKIGTYKYMAPEVYNNQPYNSAADIYSLGLVLYWLLNERRMPFMPLPPAKLSAGMDEESRLRRFSGEPLPEPVHGSKRLKAIVLKACAYEPKDRYASAVDMLADLEHLGTPGVWADSRPEYEEMPEISCIVPNTDEEDKTVGLFFRDRAREKREDEERLARERAEAENRRRMQEEKKRQRELCEEQKRRQAELAVRRRKTTIGIACMAAAILIAVLGLFLLPNSADEKPELMSDSFAEYIWNEEIQRFVPCEEPLVLGSQIPRARIRSINFLDTLQYVPEDSWDVSRELDGSVLAWVEPDGELYNLFIAGEGGVRAPQDCRHMFAGYTSLEFIGLNDCFDTAQAVDMSGMFRACAYLKELDLRGWDTSQVTDMNGMFWSCNSLEKLNIGSWKTSKVQNMSYMFRSCNNLPTLNLDSWDTLQVVDMKGTFQECRNLTELNIGTWNTSQVTDMYKLFSGCYRLTSLDLSGWELAQVQELSGMFDECYGLYAWDASQGCYVLGDLDGWNWDGDNLDKIASQASLEKKPTLMSDPVGAYHWDDEAGRNMPDVEPMVLGSQIPRAKIRSITFLDTLDNAPEDNWDVSMDRDGSVLAWVKPNGDLYDLYIAGNGGIQAPQDCSYLFAEYSALESFCLNDCFDTSRVTNMGQMFRACVNLPSLDLSNWDTSQVQNMWGMFVFCHNLAEADVSTWDTAMVQYMTYMFFNCKELADLDVSNWDTSQVTNMDYMFQGAAKLQKLDLNNWHTGQLLSMIEMFKYCSGLTELNIGTWDTSRVQDMHAMFYCCSSLTELNIGAWDTSRVQNMEEMFAWCTDLEELNIGGWDTSQVRNMHTMFYCCSNLTELDIGDWNTSEVTDMSGMFSVCDGLFTWDEARGCYVPDGLNIQNWNVDKVESFAAFVSLDGKPVELYGQPWEDFFSTTQVEWQWSSWSAWSTDKVTETDTRQVETASMYLYYAYICPHCSAQIPYQLSTESSYSICYSELGGCDATSGSAGRTEVYLSNPPSDATYWKYNKRYLFSDGVRWFINSGADPETVYRYRDIVR